MKRKQILIIALSLAVVAAGVVFLISRGANGDIDPVQQTASPTGATGANRPAAGGSADIVGDVTVTETPVADLQFHYVDDVLREFITYDIWRRLLPPLSTDGSGSLLYWLGGSYLYDLYRLGASADSDELVFSIPDRNTEWRRNADGDYSGHHQCWGYDTDAEGNRYLLYSVYGSGDFVFDIYDPEGQPVKTDVAIANAIPDDTIGMILGFQVYGELIYIIRAYDSSLYVYTLDGDMLGHPYGGYLASCMDVDDSGRMFISVSENGIRGTYAILSIDLNDEFRLIGRVSIPDGAASFLEYVPESDKVYFSDSKCVRSFSPGEPRFETVMTFGVETSFLPDISYDSGLPVLEAFLASPSGDIYFAAREQDAYGEISRLHRLTRTEGERPSQAIETTLTITAAYRQPFLEEAVRRYASERPEVEFVWDVLYASYDAFIDNVDNAAQRLATKIMANDVGDIVATGGMALQVFEILKTDAFADLLPYLHSDPIYASLNRRVIDGITIGGKLKGLPVGTAYESLVYNRELGESLGLSIDGRTTWSGLLQIALEHPDTPLFGRHSIDLVEFVRPILKVQLPDLIDPDTKTVNLEQEWFIRLMRDLKQVYSNGNLSAAMDFTLFEPFERKHLFELYTIRGSYDHLQLYYENAGGSIAYLPMPEGERNRNAIAYPLLMYSISQNSADKEAAWSFLSYLLSVGEQARYSLRASPVNREAELSMRGRHGGYPEEMGAQLDVILDNIDALGEMEGYIQDLMIPMEAYIKGASSWEEAVAKAEYDIWIRLNE